MPTNPSSHGPARRHAQAVTTAPRSQDEDRHRRMRNYLIAMGIRTVSFPLAVWAFLSHEPVLGWIFVVNAVLIPYFAVALANAVDLRTQQPSDGPASPVRGLAPTAVPDADPAPPAPTVIQGTVVESHLSNPDDQHPGRRSA